MSLADDSPSVDLVVTTKDRPRELARLLESATHQQLDGLRVLVVDQSQSDSSKRVVDEYADRLDVEYLRSSTGAARGRNVGLDHVKSELVAFPDDDCWYPDGYIRRAVEFFAGRERLDGLLTRWIDPAGDTRGTRWDAEPGRVDRYNVWTRGNTASTFLRRDVVEAVGDFDEDLGVGSPGPWQSGEETDYLIRAVDAGFHIHYEPDLFLYHPDKLRTLTPREAALRGRRYGRGMGRTLRKQRYPLWYVALWLGRPFAGAARALLQSRPDRVQYYLQMLLGRFEGWTGRLMPGSGP